VNITELLSSIDSEIARLQEARALLAGQDVPGIPTVRGVRRRGQLSAEARERIAAAQRKRWARQKSEATKTA
jgi:hypothetical protein